MPQLHLFNPENDIALAYGKSQYTAPPNALRLRTAGELLPLWFCEKGDQVISPNADLGWVKDIKSQFDINGEVASPSTLSSITQCSPWGWSLYTKKQLLNTNINEQILPSDEQIDKIRELSHRRLCIDISNQLLNYNIPNPTLPFEAHNEEEMLEYARKHQSIFLKAPWSSSGRGVINTSHINEEELKRRALGIIRNQGSVLCEKALNKVSDFAMLFFSNGVTVEYKGISSFFNTTKGAYAGNIIASQEYILKSLTQYISESSLINIANALTQILTKLIAPHYYGYFGVDMMIYRNDDIYHIAPCVEINLRMTMGVIALIWAERHLTLGSKGKMIVEYAPIKTIEENYVTINSKLKSGTISLIPPDKYFKIYISVE